MKTKVFLTTATIVALFFTAYLFAGSEIFKELRDNIQNYKAENITPQLDAWKSKIDNTLSPDDLSKLNELRSQAAAHIAQNKAERSEKRENGVKPNKDEIKAKRDEAKQFRAEIGNDLKEIVSKYPQLAEDLKIESEAKHEIWSEAIKNIHDEWSKKYSNELEKFKANRKDGKGPHGKKDRQNMNRGDGFHGEFDKERNKEKDAIARIFLYNGTLDDEFDMIPNMNSMDEIRNVPSSPNPFTNNTKIKFDLEKSGNVLVTVMNSNGTKVETIYNGNLNAGEHEFNLDGSKYTAGTYIYKIESPDGIQTGKMIKK